MKALNIQKHCVASLKCNRIMIQKICIDDDDDDLEDSYRCKIDVGLSKVDEVCRAIAILSRSQNAENLGSGM